MSELKKYLSITPNAPQKRAQRQNFNAFLHYGTNTFTDKEWGDGKASPEVFNPSAQDTDQWCRILKEAGADGAVITAKHHDGFCLWQTATTEYSIKNSPYKGGKGDVVAELSASCRKFGLKFGFYLSPWDRNCPYYGVDNDKYNDFYVAQLKELLTGYGEISYVWLDGACGSHLDGKPKQIYDFERYYSLIRELAPGACISNCGPDVRWVGNEGGFARESEWNVVPKFAFDIQSIEKKSQQDEVGAKKKKTVAVTDSDLGSRKFLSGFDQFIWYPAEVDVSIRPGWFYHQKQDNKVRSLNNLMYIYATSVGGNSLLILNVPPDKRGLIAPGDEKRLIELGGALTSAFARPAAVATLSAPPAEDGHGIENVLTFGYDSATYSPLSYYTPQEEAESYTITLNFDKPYLIDKVRLIENTDFSQRIESYKIFALKDGKEKSAYSGTTVGFNRIALFKRAFTADGIKIVIDGCREKPYLEFIEVYQTDGFIPKPSPILKLKRFVQQIGYAIYVKTHK